jgi:hypoxanthine phosphoribosyltransferase
VHVTRYGAAIEGSKVEWRVAPPADVRGRAVLVLDDILDGGHTMLAIREELRALGAASVPVRGAGRERPLSRPKPIGAISSD